MTKTVAVVIPSPEQVKPEYIGTDTERAALDIQLGLLLSARRQLAHADSYAQEMAQVLNRLRGKHSSWSRFNPPSPYAAFEQLEETIAQCRAALKQANTQVRVVADVDLDTYQVDGGYRSTSKCHLAPRGVTAAYCGIAAPLLADLAPPARRRPLDPSINDFCKACVKRLPLDALTVIDVSRTRYRGNRGHSYGDDYDRAQFTEHVRLNGMVY